MSGHPFLVSARLSSSLPHSHEHTWNELEQHSLYYTIVSTSSNSTVLDSWLHSKPNWLILWSCMVCMPSLHYYHSKLLSLTFLICSCCYHPHLFFSLSHSLFLSLTLTLSLMHTFSRANSPCRTHGNKKMAEARKDSKTQPTPQISELSATDSLRHAKGEVELIKCLGQLQWRKAAQKWVLDSYWWSCWTQFIVWMGLLLAM